MFYLNKRISLITKNIDGGMTTFIKQIKKIKNFNLLLLSLQKECVDNRKLASVNYLNNFNIDNLNCIKKTITFILNIFKLRKILQRNKFSIFILNDIYSLIIFFISVRFLNLSNNNKIFIAHTNLKKEIENKNILLKTLLLLLLKSFINKCNVIVFPSKKNKQNIIKYLNISTPKIIFIPHGVKMKKIKKLKKLNTAKIVSIGSFNIQKDFFTVIKAFAIIKDKFKNAELMLIGDGPLKNKVKEYTNKLKVSSSIFFLGWKNNVFPYLKNSDIFVYSSYYEGFGYVILEALSVGVPIIATNTPYGPSEILENGKCGILVPIGDYQKMASEIIRLIKDEKLRKKYSRLGYRRAKYFSEEKMLKKYKNLFLELISKN